MSGHGSRVAMITSQFAAMREFYEGELGFIEIEAWDRLRARGVVLQWPGGMRLELLDATAEQPPMDPGPATLRVQLVLEMDDLEGWYTRVRPGAPARETSWGGKVVLMNDPDGTAVWIRQANS